MDAIATSAVLVLAALLVMGCCGTPIFSALISRRKHTFIDGQEENMDQETVKLKIHGMTCQGCADTIVRYLKLDEGVAGVSIDWKAGTGVVAYDPEVTTEEHVLRNRAFQGHYSAERA